MVTTNYILLLSLPLANMFLMASILAFWQPMKSSFNPFFTLKYRVEEPEMEQVLYAVRQIFSNLTRHFAPSKREIDAFSPSSLVERPEAKSAIKNMLLPFCAGKGDNGEVYFEDLAKLPHLMIAGHSGSGKSVFFQNVLFWLEKCKTPLQVKVIDPKQTSFAIFNHSTKMPVEVEHDFEKFGDVLKDIWQEMNTRNAKLRKFGCEDIAEYHAVSTNRLPYIILVIDEFQDLGKKQPELKDIARKGRSAGIHLVLGTQNPNGIDIDMTVLQQCPGIACFRLKTEAASERILGEKGAPALKNKGDLIFRSPDVEFTGKAPFCRKEEFDFFPSFKKMQEKALEAERQEEEPEAGAAGANKKKRGRPKTPLNPKNNDNENDKK